MKKILFWIVRILSVLITLSLYAFVFDLIPSNINLDNILFAAIPGTILFIATAVAWNIPQIGGMFYILLSILYVVLAYEKNPLWMVGAVGGSLLVIGLGFLIIKEEKALEEKEIKQEEKQPKIEPQIETIDKTPEDINLDLPKDFPTQPLGKKEIRPIPVKTHAEDLEKIIPEATVIKPTVLPTELKKSNEFENLENQLPPLEKENKKNLGNTLPPLPDNLATETGNKNLDVEKKESISEDKKDLPKLPPLEPTLPVKKESSEEISLAPLEENITKIKETNNEIIDLEKPSVKPEKETPLEEVKKELSKELPPIVTKEKEEFKLPPLRESKKELEELSKTEKEQTNLKGIEEEEISTTKELPQLPPINEKPLIEEKEESLEIPGFDDAELVPLDDNQKVEPVTPVTNEKGNEPKLSLVTDTPPTFQEIVNNTIEEPNQTEEITVLDAGETATLDKDNKEEVKSNIPSDLGKGFLDWFDKESPSQTE